MDIEAKRFGTGSRELGGATDLINKYKLWPQYKSFCKKSIPLSISETRYLHNVVGDTEIRRGEGMELDQLFQNTSSSLRERNTQIHRFDLNVLGDAFRLKETNPVELPSAEKGIPTGTGRVESETKKEKKRKERKRKNEHGDTSRVIKKEKDNKNEKLKGELKKMKMVNGVEDFPNRKKPRSLVADTERIGRDCWDKYR